MSRSKYDEKAVGFVKTLSNMTIEDLINEWSFQEEMDLKVQPKPHGGKVTVGTGDRISEDKKLLVGALHMMGLSPRKINQLTGVNHYVVDFIVRKLAKEGKLQQLNERLQEHTGSLAEQCALASKRLLLALDENPDPGIGSTLRSVGYVLDISLRAYLQLAGEAQTLGPPCEKRREPTEAEMREWLKKLSLPAQANVEPVQEQPETEPQSSPCTEQTECSR